MKVIGHRGAASLAPENSLKGIKTALSSGVDAIEFDILVTVDGMIVLSHDDLLLRTFGVNQRISKSTLAELKKLKSLADQPIATLDEALAAADGISLLIEGKGDGWAEPLAGKLKDYASKKQLIIISFNHDELQSFGKLCPDIRRYGLANQNPLEAINTAKLLGFDGIDINYWMLNPLVYGLAKHQKLDIVVYTVNRPWLARFLRVLYPKISITTNVPQKLQFLRPKAKRVHLKSGA